MEHTGKTEYRLCGGTFFVLVSSARKALPGNNERYRGTSSGLTEPELLIGLTRCLVPDLRTPMQSEWRNVKNSVAMFKACAGTGGSFFRLGDRSVLKAFDTRVRTRYREVLDEMCRCVERFLDTDTDTKKDEYLVKALVEVLEGDPTVPEEQPLYARADGSTMTKRELCSAKEICLQPFLLGLWHYVLLHTDNKTGSRTYENWCPPKGGAPRAYEAAIGEDSRREIKLTYCAPPLRPAAHTEEPTERTETVMAGHTEEAAERTETVTTAEPNRQTDIDRQINTDRQTTKDIYGPPKAGCSSERASADTRPSIEKALYADTDSAEHSGAQTKASDGASVPPAFNITQYGGNNTQNTSIGEYHQIVNQSFSYIITGNSGAGQSAAFAAPTVSNVPSASSAPTVSSISTISTASTEPAGPEIRILGNTEYYHLFVTDGEIFRPFSSGSFIVDKARALKENTAPEISAGFLNSLEFLMTVPALFAAENEGGSYGTSTETQLAYFGFVTGIEILDRGIRIGYQTLNPIPQMRLNAMRKELGLAGTGRYNEFDRIHWAVKRVPLVQALRKAGITVFAPN